MVDEIAPSLQPERRANAAYALYWFFFALIPLFGSFVYHTYAHCHRDTAA